MADSRITELNELLGANLAANDVLPVSDVSASETKKIKAKSLIEGGVALADAAFIDLSKLNQSSTTKIGGVAIASGSIDASKLANDSTIAVETTAPSGNNFEGRGFFNSSSGNLQIFSGADYAQVVVPTAGIGDLQVTTDKLADGAVTTTKVTALGTAAYADSSVTSGKIADGAITTAKIAAGAVTASQIAAGSLSGAGLASATVTYDKLQNVSATDRLLGRTSAGAGSVEEISCTAAGRALLDDADAATQRATLGLGTISTGNGTWADGGSFSGTSSGTNTGDQTITLTGDITGTGTGSFATTIATGAVVEGKIATNAVTTSKINDDAITAEKLADSSAAIVAASSPAGSGAFIGQQWFNTNNGQEFTWTGTAWIQQAGIGTINIVDSTPIAIAVAYPDPYSATLTTTLDTQTAATVFAGPETGADAAPTFRAIVPGDLPDATASTKGIIQPGTGLAVDAGTLNHANTVSGATVSSITFDNQGHITAAVPLVAADIPNLDVSKITTGELPTVRYADASITASKIADYANVQIGETLPVADHIGQFFFNPLDGGSVFLWDGNVWQPVGVTTGAIVFAGTFDASTPSGVGQVGSVTAAGAAVGLIAGSGLPAASPENSEYYLVVASGGTITTGNAPFRTLAPPDLILSDGAAWVEVDVSAGAGSIAASNVSFSAGGDIGSTSVQGAIEEVSTECRNANNITSGTLAVARGGTGIASYTKGDLIAASGSTVLAKLPVGTNTHVLRANSSTDTGLEWGADFVGTVTTVSSATAALTVATATTTPALTLRSATTSVNGIVQLSDSISTTSSILAATPTAVKTAYDLANAALPKAGGTVTGDITLGTNIGLQFEGTTDDSNEIRLIGADATEGRTITLPNLTGTVALTSQLDDGAY
jgi:trimeric autotransporter adhesin